MSDIHEGWQEPCPGDIVLLQIKGLTGKLVWLLQALNGDLSKWTHAGVMLDDGTIYEAQPGGSVMTDWALYRDRPHTIVRHHLYRELYYGGAIEMQKLSLTVANREAIVTAARLMGPGVGYNWTTYFYLAAYRVGIRPQWLKNRVQKDKRMICSQAADQIYNWAGISLFDDGRMSYDVIPGDLARLT